ncbi:hypothetical protein H5410_031144 [Solanum commersonii]|uniref:Uncharacterized protein n=1 Tax=Solanum commersonii TaxID=4109 RepID=A0A9J5YLF6_SOLCO|nr:hypothetical protein H5410_031144 [Solanum commersonii]
MWKFHQKLKRLAGTLSSWSKGEFETFIQHTEENRAALHEFNDEYIRFLKLEDSILKQKTQLQWFREGDSNTKYFHSLIRGRRRRLFIRRILKDDGD